jgi:hypothetical protein
MTRRIAVLSAVLFLCSSAALAAPPNTQPLHAGQHGRRVADLQWLLGGHKPSAYRLATFKWKPNGSYGARTKSAVLKMKWRLGFPKRALTPSAGGDFLRILKGNVARPRLYLVRAAARAPKPAVATVAPWARKLISIERHELGVHEIPDGSNAGGRVLQYEIATGALRAPWCVSFQQWARLRADFHTIAGGSASVFYTVDWARARGLARATPEPGRLVAFLDRLGHMGLVARVVRGGFYSIEGNASNSVLERYHPTGERPMLFIAAAGTAPAT